MIATLFLAMAHAGSLELSLSTEGGRTTLLHAQHRPQSQGHVPMSKTGDLQILGPEGELLGALSSDLLLRRSIILPEGGGASALLQGGVVTVTLPWPEGASRVQLGGQSLVPIPAPPMPEGPEALLVSGSGSPEQRLDLVFLGDGYTADELDTFAEDVDRMVAYLGTVEPYGDYAGLFNVWRIDLASNESGVSHREGGSPIERDTAYGCYYGCGGIARLICCESADVLPTLRGALPEADGALVLVNDPTYGGSGGFDYAVSYNGQPYDVLVGAHELGHSLVGLWDEYSYGSSWSDGSEGPNCTTSGDSPPWDEWTDESGVGAFPVCSYTNYFRPTDQACMMNTLQDGYCPVCRQEVVLAIYRKLPSLLQDLVPQEGVVALDAEGRASLSATALGPGEEHLSARWLLDGVELGQGLSITLEGCPQGVQLTLEVQDPTPWVRSDPEGLLSDSAQWTLDRSACARAFDDTDAAEDKSGPGSCGCNATPTTSGLIGVISAIALALCRRLTLSW